ncbi:MAG TPA: hypothetical protein VFE47_30810 [Tepidisphaeraceae bacterium]|jgi:hypothetical protein|nr:hypothetical protein [Tepidisphaeraceae bacterium]
MNQLHGEFSFAKSPIAWNRRALRRTEGQLQGITTPDWNAYTVIRRNNKIVVRTSDVETMNEIGKLIERLDVPTSLVLGWST